MSDTLYLVLLDFNKDHETMKSPCSISTLCDVCVQELELSGKELYYLF